MLAQTLRYPLQGHALPIIIVFALLFWVGSASLFGLVATAIAISWPMKYAYRVLERSARGHRDPPPMTIELVNPVSQQPLKHLFVLGVLFSLCYWVNALLGGWVSTLLLVAGLALQPAVAAVIALDDNLFAALEPRALTAIARQLGVDYGLTAAWLVASAMIVFFAAPQLPRGIWYALLLYAVLSCFHLLGLALYRHRDQLGIDADLSPEREAADQRTSSHRHLNRILDQAYSLANGNRHKAAAETLISALAADGDRLEDHGYIHQQTRQWAAPQASLRHGQVYISRLWQAQRSAEAVEVYGHCQRLSDAFRLEDAAQVLPLARTAISINRSFLAAHMLRQFEQRFPSHPDCGAVVRLRATLESH